MLTKLSTFAGTDSSGEPLVRVFHQGDSLKEVASAYQPEVQDFLSTYKSDLKKIALLVNALGGSEYYGQNSNGDIFYWSALIHNCKAPNHSPHPYDSFYGKIIPPYGYTTFLDAHPFVHHKNKDPNRAFGNVAVSCLNHKMKRVELVVLIDRDRAAEFDAQSYVDRIDSGDFPDVSMGARVPYDVCVVCNHKSKTKEDYCSHVRELGMNHVLPDGRKVGVINPHPRFFDISFVFIGADRTAKVMTKLGSNTAGLPRSIVDAEEIYGRSLDDEGTMIKAASIDVDNLVRDVKDLRDPPGARILDEFNSGRLERIQKAGINNPYFSNLVQDIFYSILEDPELNDIRKKRSSTPSLPDDPGHGEGQLRTNYGDHLTPGNESSAASKYAAFKEILAGCDCSKDSSQFKTTKAVTHQQLLDAAEKKKQLGAKDVSITQLAKGMQVEKEHDSGDPQTDVLSGPPKDNKKLHAQIALAHLKELPDYYTRLEKMEKGAEEKLQPSSFVEKAGRIYEEIDTPEGRKAVVYHGTDLKNFNSILKKGLIPGYKRGGFRPNLRKAEGRDLYQKVQDKVLNKQVFFSGDPKEAQIYSLIAHTPQNKLKELDESYLSKSSNTSRYPVIKALIDPDKLTWSSPLVFDERGTGNYNYNDGAFHVGPVPSSALSIMSAGEAAKASQSIQKHIDELWKKKEETENRRLLELMGSFGSKSKVAEKELQAPPYRAQYPYCGKYKFKGLTINVENPKGTWRVGKGWKTLMKNDYGEIADSYGSDGDPIDVYIGPKESSDKVFIIHQNHVSGPKKDQYDEDKIMLGFVDSDSAKKAYLSHYDNPDFLRSITEMTFDQFKTLIFSKEMKREKIANMSHPLTGDMLNLHQKIDLELHTSPLANKLDRLWWKTFNATDEDHTKADAKVQAHPELQALAKKHGVKFTNFRTGTSDASWKFGIEKTASFSLEELFQSGSNGTAVRRERTWRDKVTGHSTHHVGSGLGDSFETMDKTAGVDSVLESIFKTASPQTNTEAAKDLLARLKLAARKIAEEKKADVVKDIEPDITTGRVVENLTDSEEPIPPEVLNSLGEKGVEKALSTSSLMGMVLHPEEFQRVILSAIGKTDLADALDNAKTTFQVRSSGPEQALCDGLGPSHFDPSLMKMLLPSMEGRSYLGPIVERRLVRVTIMPKAALKHEGSDSPLLSKVASAYNWYRTEMLKAAICAPEVVREHPELYARLYDLHTDDIFSKTAAINDAGVNTLGAMIAAIPLSLMLSASLRRDIEQGKDVGLLKRLIADHPYLAMLGSSALVREAMKHPRTNQIVGNIAAEAMRAGQRIIIGKA